MGTPGDRRHSRPLGVVASGVAFANWTVAVTGDGAATASSAIAIDDAVLTVTGQLYPGLETNGTLVITNPNPFNVAIIDIEFTNLGAPDDCVAVVGGTNEDVRFTDLIGLDFVITAAGEDPVESTIVLPNFVVMDGEASNDCQGGSFTADVTIKAESTIAAVKLEQD